jgi:single-strand DNA-binding protein
MAGSVNKVFLMGNLTRDVELKYTPSDQPVANIGIAVSRRYRTREGEDREETTFVDCEAWGRTAEVMNQYLSKGRPVFVEGRLKLDQWEARETGKSRSKLRVVVENFQFVDSPGGGGGGGGGRGGNRPQPAGATSGPPASGGGPHEPVKEDDIPF